MAGWHHRLNGHGFGWTLGVDDGQGGLACCDSWGRKESDMRATELNWTIIFEAGYLGLVSESALRCSPQSTWEIEVAWKPGDESTSPEFLRFGLGQWEQEQITHRDFIRHGAPVLMQHNSLFRGDTVHILEQKKCKKVSSNEDLLPQNPESFAHRATWRTLAACLSFPSLSVLSQSSIFAKPLGLHLVLIKSAWTVWLSLPPNEGVGDTYIPSFFQVANSC